MSRIIWHRGIFPALDAQPQSLSMPPYEGTVQDVIPYPTETSEIAIPDPRAFRSMSRASVFLSHICAESRESLRPFLEKSPFSVGIYCAVENGPIDGPSTGKIVQANASPDALPFSELYRKLRNPKMYLKQLPNLAPAQMGISMGLQGPMNVYTHSVSGGIHALEQAEWDLRDGTVQAALVCTAHAIDDFLLLQRTRRFDSRPLAEGAAALLLVSDGEITPWRERTEGDPRAFFGISDPIVQIVRQL